MHQAAVVPALDPSAFRARLPAEGLFAEKDWLVSPKAFPLNAAEIEDLEKLGHRLHGFVRACNLLYNLSVKGKRPAWIADYLDRGKPPELLEKTRQLRDALPRVIRPDIIPTETGYAIAELDSVPGGIGLTGWLGRTYAALTGADIVGGSDGMIDGFRSIFPAGDILVSDEAATYRPEMQWLAAQLSGAVEVHRAEDYTPRAGRSVYRFFEMFDLPNIPAAQELLEASAAGEIDVTPPMKPHLEEKMWTALFWSRPLRDFWRRELRESHFRQLQDVFPFSWVLDPAPLPHHAVLPGLEIHDWSELGDFSQRDRDLILKISGFSEKAWGSRGVVLAQDMSQHAWKEALQRSLAAFDHHPHVLQRFHKGRLVTHSYFDRDTGEVRTMQGRVRLCPYYFIGDGKTKLGGVLATICPADKKLLHGMSDAIIVPCRVT